VESEGNKRPVRRRIVRDDPDIGVVITDDEEKRPESIGLTRQVFVLKLIRRKKLHDLQQVLWY
jgi:hypothetical protein